jgi:hypothetical protein
MRHRQVGREMPESLFAFYRHAGVVGDLLAQARQRVEEARLARVRIARERNRQRLYVFGVQRRDRL